MKKNALLIMILLFLVGCEARYNITINEDLTVDESIVGLENNEFYERYYNSSKERVINFVISLKEEYLNKNNYSKENITEGNLTGLKVNKKYNSLEEYFSTSIAYQQLYGNIDYEIKENVVKISLNDKLQENGNSLDRYLIDNGNISITLPFKVLNHNADKVEDNTYIWDVNSYNDKTINISFDKNKIVKDTSFGIYIVFGLLFIMIIVVFIYALNKIKNKNSF